MAQFWLWLAFIINLYMGIGNLVPVFPLDGGHVLRSILTAATGFSSIAGLLSGAISLSVALVLVRFIFAEYQTAGWEGLQVRVFQLGIVVVVVVYSCLVLWDAMSNLRREWGKVERSAFQDIAIALTTILVVGGVIALHLRGYGVLLPYL